MLGTVRKNHPVNIKIFCSAFRNEMLRRQAVPLGPLCQQSTRSPVPMSKPSRPCLRIMSRMTMCWPAMLFWASVLHLLSFPIKELSILFMTQVQNDLMLACNARLGVKGGFAYPHCLTRMPHVCLYPPRMQRQKSEVLLLQVICKDSNLCRTLHWLRDKRLYNNGCFQCEADCSTFDPVQV